MKKKPSSQETSLNPQSKSRKRNAYNYWVIQAATREPVFFMGNEYRAEGRRQYYGVEYSCKAWKRLATNEEIEAKQALSGIDKKEIVYTPRKKKENLLKKHFDASEEEIIQANLRADKVMAHNSKLQETHQRKTREIHARNQQPVRRKRQKQNTNHEEANQNTQNTEKKA